MFSPGSAGWCATLRHRANLVGGGGARPILAKAERGGAIFADFLRLALLHPKTPAVHVCLLSDRVARFNHSLGFLGREDIELAGPALTLHRQALRNRRALRQDTVEGGIMPARREIDRAVMECVAIDEAGERRKRQVGAIDRVGE